jgi:hypothetical protein
MEVIQHKGKWYLKSNTGYREIVATTNPKLNKDIIFDKNYFDDGFIKGLPKPTDQFIQQWIDKGYPKFINVECEETKVYRYLTKEEQIKRYGYKASSTPYMNNVYSNELKISKNNTITCSFIEDDWDSILNPISEANKDDLIKYLKRYFNSPTKKTV